MSLPLSSFVYSIDQLPKSGTLEASILICKEWDGLDGYAKGANRENAHADRPLWWATQERIATWLDWVASAKPGDSWYALHTELTKIAKSGPANHDGYAIRYVMKPVPELRWITISPGVVPCSGSWFYERDLRIFLQNQIEKELAAAKDMSVAASKYEPKSTQPLRYLVKTMRLLPADTTLTRPIILPNEGGLEGYGKGCARVTIEQEEAPWWAYQDELAAWIFFHLMLREPEKATREQKMIKAGLDAISRTGLATRRSWTVKLNMTLKGGLEFTWADTNRNPIPHEGVWFYDTDLRDFLKAQLARENAPDKQAELKTAVKDLLDHIIKTGSLMGKAVNEATDMVATKLLVPRKDISVKVLHKETRTPAQLPPGRSVVYYDKGDLFSLSPSQDPHECKWWAYEDEFTELLLQSAVHGTPGDPIKALARAGSRSLNPVRPSASNVTSRYILMVRANAPGGTHSFRFASGRISYIPDCLYWFDEKPLSDLIDKLVNSTSYPTEPMPTTKLAAPYHKPHNQPLKDITHGADTLPTPANENHSVVIWERGNLATGVAKNIKYDRNTRWAYTSDLSQWLRHRCDFWPRFEDNDFGSIMHASTNEVLYKVATVVKLTTLTNDPIRFTGTPSGTRAANYDMADTAYWFYELDLMRYLDEQLKKEMQPTLTTTEVRAAMGEPKSKETVIQFEDARCDNIVHVPTNDGKGKSKFLIRLRNKRNNEWTTVTTDIPEEAQKFVIGQIYRFSINRLD